MGFLRGCLALGFTVLILVALIGLYGVLQLKAAGPHDAPVVVVIDHGSSSYKIRNILKRENAINETAAHIFPYIVRLTVHKGDLKSGEYELEQGISALTILQKMRDGDVIKRQVTIPEGLMTVEIVNLLNAVEDISGPQIVDALKEGVFLPESYAYQRSDTRADVLKRMSEAMSKTLDDLWEERQKDLPLKNKQDALILASIIEKETGVTGERSKVAGVFINRLRKGMMLQTDPTVIYAITEGKKVLKRQLYFKDLKRQHPYNTYTNVGLPPGPIANPGRKSIEAALNPAAHDYLYFVADGTGGHAFAKTFAGHNKNVAAWRKIQRQK